MRNLAKAIVTILGAFLVSIGAGLWLNVLWRLFMLGWRTLG